MKPADKEYLQQLCEEVGMSEILDVLTDWCHVKAVENESLSPEEQADSLRHNNRAILGGNVRYYRVNAARLQSLKLQLSNLPGTFPEEKQNHDRPRTY